jgi:outer membrane protein assembly factor BamB
LEHKEGPGSSPVLDGPRLILTCDGMDVQYMIALDTKTGENVWKTNRSADLSGFDPDQRKGYSTPLVTEYQGQPLLISTAAQAAYAYDPHDGRELWRFQYKGFSNVVRPLVFGDLVILNTGFAKANVFGVRLGGRGDITESHFVWKQTQACPNKPCPVLIDGLLYSVSDKGGVASCLDAKTGEKLWTERLGGNYSASLLYASGRIYAFDQDGKTIVFRPGQKYEELATNQLDEGFMASPAVAGDALYLRTKTHLYRIEAGAKSAE